MTRDRIYAAELAHDTSGASDREVEACMGEAMDGIVDDLMNAEKARGLSWGMQDFLDEQADLGELVSAYIFGHNDAGVAGFEAEIERRLRRELADHDAVHDRAVEIANQREES